MKKQFFCCESFVILVSKKEIFEKGKNEVLTRFHVVLAIKELEKRHPILCFVINFV